MSRRLAQPERAERQMLLAAVVITAILVLAVLVALLVSLRSEVPEPVLPARDATRAQAVAAISPLGAEPRQAMLERPLFWSSRRPLAPVEETDEPVDEAQVADELKNLIVLGLFSDGDNGGMIVRFKQQRKRVAVGESIAGWELASVGAGKVTMTRGERRSDVPLKREDAAKANSKTNKSKRTIRASNQR